MYRKEKSYIMNERCDTCFIDEKYKAVRKYIGREGKEEKKKKK